MCKLIRENKKFTVTDKLPTENTNCDWIIYDETPIHKTYYKEIYQKCVCVVSETTFSDNPWGFTPEFIYIVQYTKNVPNGQKFRCCIIPKIQMQVENVYVINYKDARNYLKKK